MSPHTAIQLKQDTLPDHVSNTSIVSRISAYTGFVAASEKHRFSAYRLRHQVYCEELNWQPRQNSRLESDVFDTDATSICVASDEGKIVATIRLLDETQAWLVDHSFPDTLTRSSMHLRKKGYIEASRLAICPSMRNVPIDSSGTTALDLLLITLINYSWDYLGKKSVLITTTPLMAVTLKRRGIAIEQAGEIITMADNCKVASYLCDLEVSRDQYRHYGNYMHQSIWPLAPKANVASRIAV